MAVQLIKDFNALLEVLIQQVSPMTGNSYHILFKNLIKFNAPLPIQVFYQHASPYKEHILNRDEKFFLDERNINQMVKENHEENMLDEIFSLRNVWTKLDNDSKNNLWEIVQALYQLAEQYYQMKN